MRCRACNKSLSDRESSRKYLELEEYIELCHKCTIEAGILYQENEFLVDKPDDEDDVDEHEDEPLWKLDHAY